MNPRSREPGIRRAPMSSAQRREMTQAVMQRTSGSACERATRLLGGQFDEPFDAPTRALVELHVEHCDACRAVSDTLADVGPVLATLASIDPRPEFTADVVAVTSGRRSGAGASIWSVLSWRPAWMRALNERAAVAWERLLARPRLSLELAYLATVLLVLIVGNPGLIADALGARTSTALAGETTAATADVRAAGVGAPTSGWAIPTIVDRALREVERGQSSAAKGWNWLFERTSQWLSDSWNWLRGVLGWKDTPAPAAPTEPSTRPMRGSH